jgi:hypothetical protein
MPRTGARTYLRRTNAPGTCKWCGKKLTDHGYGYTKSTDGAKGYNFCSLVCTEFFAVAMLKNGYLLKPYEGHPDGKEQKT